MPFTAYCAMQQLTSVVHAQVPVPRSSQDSEPATDADSVGGSSVGGSFLSTGHSTPHGLARRSGSSAQLAKVGSVGSLGRHSPRPGEQLLLWHDCVCA